MLSDDDLRNYHRDGFIVLRGAISDADITRLERGVDNNPPLDGTLDPYAPAYPAPGRYTLATQCLKDPDLAFIVEHEAIVGAVRKVLDDDPILTAYVIYDRTPGGQGLPAHHDYKRWRPVGSSMHWLFTVVPFCDFDADVGPLYVAPGSHHLERISTGTTPCAEVSPAIKPEPEDFIDPQLKRGDLLLMNMHLWHKADANRSSLHRVGLFNKYAAAHAPPATGYYLYDNDVYAALSDQGKALLGVHSNRSIITTRAILTRERDGETELYLQDTASALHLPGGSAWDERAIPDWDLGNMIAPLRAHLIEQVNIEIPWLSYIGDYEEGEGLCRVYGYSLNDHGFPVPYEGSWLKLSAVETQHLGLGWELQAANLWLDPTIVRGKGLSQAQSRIDQFAY
jgi:hypothetical protein